MFCKVRTESAKFSMAVDEHLADQVQAVLDRVQAGMLEAALARREAATHRVDTYDQLKAGLDNGGGFFLVAWTDDAEAEAAIKADCKATIRCYPLEGQHEAQGRTCFYSGKPATHMAIFARAY